MPRRNNPDNLFVKKGSKKTDDQPWNRSRMQIEPAEGPALLPPGQYQDRIKVAPTDEGGAATPRAIKGWPEGIKKA